MEFSIQTIIGIIIVVIIFLAILVLLGVVPLQGETINVRNKILLCCGKYVANDCTEDVICDYETYETIYGLAGEIGMQENSYEQLKIFCNCP